MKRSARFFLCVLGLCAGAIADSSADARTFSANPQKVTLAGGTASGMATRTRNAGSGEKHVFKFRNLSSGKVLGPATVMATEVAAAAGNAADNAAPEAENEAAAAVSFAGTWDTVSGGGSTPFKVTMEQTGRKVTGSFSPGNGKIFDGVVVGRSVGFKWTQNGGFEGTAEFTMDEDGKGFKGSSTALKPRKFTNVWNSVRTPPPAPPPPPPASFAGTWNTFSGGEYKYGLELFQDGNKVTGIYAPGNGRISGGVVEGQILRFRWTQDGGLAGSGRFVVSDDGKTFTGHSNQGDDPDTYNNSWTGTRAVHSFSGSWDLTANGAPLRVMNLSRQRGRTFGGTFFPGNGQISDGVVTGNILTFNWSQDGGLKGTGHWELAEDGQSLKGSLTATEGPITGETPNTAKRRPIHFGGSWALVAGGSYKYVFTLKQTGDKVTGTYSPLNGRVEEGKVIDDTLYFRWSQDGGRTGTGYFVLDESKRALTGGFRSGSEPEIKCTATKFTDTK